MGEILATEFIDECVKYSTPIKRLRWKDHRDMAMRGDDVIGFAISANGKTIEFLKCESKSKKALSTLTIENARKALESDEGLPSPHALSFIADRLNESGQLELADHIDATLLNGISPQQVEHLLFIFSGSISMPFIPDHKTTIWPASIFAGFRLPRSDPGISCL